MPSDIPQHLIIFVSLAKVQSENKNFTSLLITLSLSKTRGGKLLCTVLANGIVHKNNRPPSSFTGF